MTEFATADPEKKSPKKNDDPFSALTEWSKWLIGINFASATGCLVVLKTAAENSPPDLLLLHELQGAIFAFCLSVVCAIFLIFRASIDAIKPNQKIDKSLKIFTLLGYAQMFFFIIALVFLNSWVDTKANPKVDDCAVKCQNLRNAVSGADKTNRQRFL